jgi:hypothetical protein
VEEGEAARRENAENVDSPVGELSGFDGGNVWGEVSLTSCLTLFSSRLSILLKLLPLDLP